MGFGGVTQPIKVRRAWLKAALAMCEAGRQYSIPHIPWLGQWLTNTHTHTLLKVLDLCLFSDEGECDLARSLCGHTRRPTGAPVWVCLRVVSGTVERQLVQCAHPFEFGREGSFCTALRNSDYFHFMLMLVICACLAKGLRVCHHFPK